MRNVTTNELANWRRYGYLQLTTGQFHNPFDRGWRRNVWEAFFPARVPVAPVYIAPRDPLSVGVVCGSGGCGHKH
jgi:hypothetical protein